MICFERLPYVNWFNPLVTLYLNFRSFPLRQAWKLPVIVYGWPKLFSLQGRMECVDKCQLGMVRLNRTNPDMPNNPGYATAIYNMGKILFHGKCLIYTANKINIGENGVLNMGEDTKIMCMCNITAHHSVTIGPHSWISHRCQVMDSNYHYVVNFNNHTISRYTRPVEIGSYCWICNSTTIAAGTKIPDKSIVASNSLVNKDLSAIPEESMIGGIPAKLISTGYRKVDSRTLINKIKTYFKDNPDKDYLVLDDGVDHAVCDVDE